MKIESKKIINQTVNFFNKDVTFDKFGKAEVENELAASIIESFGDIIWEEGKQVIKKVDKVKDDSEEVLKLKDEINRLEGVNSGLKIQLAQAKEQEQVWRDECVKYEQLVKAGAAIQKEDITKIQDEIIVPEGYDDVYKEMQTKNLESLKEMCKNDLGVSEENLVEFKGKGGKEKLIKYIFENVIK